MPENELTNDTRTDPYVAAKTNDMRAARSSLRLQIISASGGFVAPAIALLALFGSQVMPPRSPSDSAEMIAQFYSTNSNLKMAGLIAGFMAIGFLGPLLGAITMQLLRIEGRRPIATFIQVISGAVTWVFLGVPLLILFVAAFRANDRMPEMTQALHDLAWILFLIPVAPFVVLNIAIAVVIFGDTSCRKVFPRWVAWANLLIAASFLPDLLLGFFKVGPFAYNGLLSFWIPTVTYGLWLNMMAYATVRAARNELRAIEARVS